MKLKQKLLGFGLAALLNGGCKDGNHFDYNGTITNIRYYSYGARDVNLYNESSGRAAFVEFKQREIPDYLMYHFEVENTLKLTDCDYNLKYDRQTEPPEKVYILSDCELE